MLDEYVQHSNGPTGGNLPSQQLHYEGFEPSSHEQEDSEVAFSNVGRLRTVSYAPSINVTGKIESFAFSKTQTPIFDLGRVQYTFPASLISFVVCSDMLVMGFVTNLLVLIELQHSDQIVSIQIPRKPTDMTLHKLFMDPSGRHIIVTSTQGENWYLYRGWKKPRQLKGFKMVIESIAWNKPALLSANAHATSTREFLIGARNGTIYEAVLDAEEDFFKSQERYLQAVYSLPERLPIMGIHFDILPHSELRKALVIATTSTRIYQFVGVCERRVEEVGRVFSGLFGSYRDIAPKIWEIPGQLDRSELRFYTPNPDQASSLAKSMAWMTGLGVYNGMMKYDSLTDDFIDNAQLLPYPTFTTSNENTEFPVSVALTEFHFMLLYKNKIAGVCNLNDELVYEESLPLKGAEQVLGISADPTRKTYWVFTDQTLFELVVGNEDRDVWRIYLEKNQFDIALEYAKTAEQRDQVFTAQADAYFKENRFFQAAQCFAQSSTSFEEVVLRFLDAGERDALRSYIISRLERTRKVDSTQRMILATWLVEFYLSKCNELDDIFASESVSNDTENIEAERKILEDDLRHFFDTYKNNLDQSTMYELIQGHGRTDMYLYFATAVEDYKRVAEHWIMEDEWLKALETLNRQNDLELYYRFGPVLMRQIPKETTDSWLKQPNLDPIRLIPSILQTQHTPPNPLMPNQAIRYLNHLIYDRHVTIPTIHNLLITLYVQPCGIHRPSEDDGPLLRFLSTAPLDPLTGKPYYDLDYALRLCKSTGRTQPCVHIYSQMGLWENSVDLALEKGDLELAKINADMPDDDIQLRKKLWLKIAKYVVQDKKDIKTAMRFLENTELLKIEDILPFFPDFVVIDDFKEEIAHALEGYSSHIGVLKKEMDESTQTAEAIKQEIVALKNRFLTIDANEQCSVCSQLLLSRQFYVFPCRHYFHADCLIGLAKDYLPATALRRIVTLQSELLKNAASDASPVIANNANGSGILANQGKQQVARHLISANFGQQIVQPIVQPINTGARAAGVLGRSVISAGDRLRDLIVPDALAALVTAPSWIPGTGKKSIIETDASEQKEKLRADLEDVLASNCPLCESVVAGLDKPFVKEGEADTTWTI